jgi:hypothetical protein
MVSTAAALVAMYALAAFWICAICSAVDGSGGHLAVCRKENRVMVYPFGAKVASKPVQDLRPCMKNIWNSNSVVGNEYCKYIHLADVAAICG